MAWWCPFLGCYKEPCYKEPYQGLWSACSLVLCWCLFSMVQSKATRMPRVWTSTWDYDVVWGACCYQGHDYLGGLHCYMKPWCHLDSDYCHGPCLHQWRAIPRVWVNVLISCCRLGLIGCLGSGQPPEIMSVFDVLAATGTILIQVACAVTRAMVISGSMVLWRECLGPCVCCRWGSLIMPMAYSMTWGSRKYFCWNLEVIPCQPHPSLFLW